MKRITALSLLALALGLAACGGDDDETESAETTPTRTEAPAATTPPPVETTEETETEAETGSSAEDEINRADAQNEAARQAGLAANDVPESDLFFAGKDDVECTAPDATQPDNANERAAEWTCTVDAETNGVACEGTVTVFSSPGANPGKTFEDIDVRDADISCAPA